MKYINIGDKTLTQPIIQGGMGIGVSRSRLAGAVASVGGMGVLSAVQIGYDAPDFREDPEKANLRMLGEEIARAREISGGRGMIGVNIMMVVRAYEKTVREAVRAGVDAIICGAGLPLRLPEFTEGSATAIAPIVSSLRAAELILKSWERKFARTADFLVMEGPFAGGHLGFSREDLSDLGAAQAAFERDVSAVVEMKKRFEDRFGHAIPLFAAGGIDTKERVRHMLSLGADGIQAASRFVTTQECDASLAYKQAYLSASREEVMIVESPVGMPGRALRNAFTERVMCIPEKITHCYQCMSACNPGKARYCISQALINAVKGDVDNGLIFCGGNIGSVRELETVRNVVEDMVGWCV